MQTKFIEVVNVDPHGTPFNHGKFMLGRWTDSEWNRRSEVYDDPAMSPLLRSVGWADYHLLVLDLQTGEGVVLAPFGLASADLHKHQVWVCPMYEPFLEWLYKQPTDDIEALPSYLELPMEDAPPAMAGYRRPGPSGDAPTWWMVVVNNGQRSYALQAPSAGDACSAGGDAWRADDTVTPKQRKRGIYAITARHAKFGEVSQQPKVPVRATDT